MAYLGLSIRGGERREEELRFARKVGYTAVEISLDGTGLVFGGRLHPPMLRDALAAFRKHEFRYSVHSPVGPPARPACPRQRQLRTVRSPAAGEFYPLPDADPGRYLPAREGRPPPAGRLGDDSAGKRV